MAEIVVSKKRKFGRIFRLTIGVPPNQVAIEDMYEPGVAARRISFDVQSALGSYTQGANIQIYNLDPEEVKKITSIKSPVTLQAGYKGVHGENPPVIFTGNVEYPNSQRSGLDIVTTLTCFAYRSTLSNTPELSYEEGISLSQVFSDLSLTDNEGNPLPYQIIGSSLQSVNLRDDFNSGSMSAQDILDFFAKNYGFSWWCDTITKQLIIIDQGEPLKKNEILLVNASTGLIKEPELNYDGLSFETSLEPSLRYRDIVRIEYPRGISQFSIGTDSANLRSIDSALVSINAIQHSGDSRGDDWKTTARGLWYTP